MVIDAQTLDRSLTRYVHDVRRKIPIDRAYLFGSYAQGTPHEWSDVDVCFFSPSFEGKHSVDAGVELLEIARPYLPDICFEPHSFPTSELENDNPFVKEVLRTGREIVV
jgi:predicted nucleotidyltransferase